MHCLQEHVPKGPACMCACRACTLHHMVICNVECVALICRPIRKFADEYKQKGYALHVLLNNAAIQSPKGKRGAKTEDGFEVHYIHTYASKQCMHASCGISEVMSACTPLCRCRWSFAAAAKPFMHCCNAKATLCVTYLSQSSCASLVAAYIKLMPFVVI